MNRRFAEAGHGVGGQEEETGEEKGARMSWRDVSK
ncbi:hypothetical protein FHS44_001520 [Streptosporangium saharense]|uniref:Uncharacterized protein n=1 Tax=Streptosporangium saharense TaxID=1706840 RepID=A0A7W7QJ30_9ACTN|nr:hypothetical protein [Streptosporangium saharense]